MKTQRGLTRRRLGKYLIATGAASLASPLLFAASPKGSRALNRKQKDDLKKALVDTEKTLTRIRAASLEDDVAPAFVIPMPENGKK